MHSSVTVLLLLSSDQFSAAFADHQADTLPVGAQSAEKTVDIGLEEHVLLQGEELGNRNDGI